MINRKDVWKGNEWYKISEQTYVIIYTAAKERFEDILSESESITNKSINIATGLVVVCAFIISKIDTNVFKNDFALAVLVILAIEIITAFILLLILLFPKEIRNRGMLASKLVLKEMSDNENDGLHNQMIYYNMISMIEGNTKEMISINKGRAFFYKISLILFLVSLLLTGLYLFATLG